jgi:hypothetical protein
LPRDWSGLVEQGSRSALGVAGGVVPAGGVATSVFDLLTSLFRQKVERSLRAFSNLERGIVLDIRRVARRRPVLLIIDNAHWCDADSLSLLGDLLSDQLRDAVGHLESLVVLLIDTAAEQEPVALEQFKRLTAQSSHKTWRTSACTRQQFPEVLASFGLRRELPDEVLDALYGATGGHLTLCEQVAAYALDATIDELVKSRDGQYIATLISARLASLGSAGAAIEALLGRAAVIGLTFDERELACLADEVDDDIPGLISEAEAVWFLQRTAGRVSFAHDVLRSALLDEQAPAATAGYRRKLEQCLSILRPSDYAARAELLLQAGDRERGRDLYAMAAVAQIRDGVAGERVLRATADRFPDDADLHRSLETIASGYAAVASGDFASALPRLRTPSSTESSLIGAERTYVAAICSMELETNTAFDEAREMLASWRHFVATESEVGLRYQLLLQQAEVLSGHFDEARATERSIERRLLARARYDQDAAVMLQIQNRRSAALDVPEIAEHRIRESVSFFRQVPLVDVRRTQELFRSLTNLSGAEIKLGKNADAYVTASEAERLALDAPDAIARLDVLANNLVIAALRSGAIDAREAAARQAVVVESNEGGTDKFIHRCNLVAFRLLSSDDERASKELAGLDEEMVARELTESYLVFYLRSLQVAADLIAGNVGAALERHRSMQAFVNGLRWPTAAYVRRRHDLLVELAPLMNANSDREKFDSTVLDFSRDEIGPAWSYYARLIPCCELAYWSDS